MNKNTKILSSGKSKFAAKASIALLIFSSYALVFGG